MAEIVELLFHMFICFVFSFIIVSVRSIRLNFCCGFIFIVVKFISIQCKYVHALNHLKNYLNIGSGIRERNNDTQQIQRQIKIASELILA